MSDYKVDPETAELEFDRLAEAYDIDTDVDEMLEDDLEVFTGLKATIVRAIRRGQLVVNEDGVPTIKLVRPFELKGKAISELTFTELQMSHIKAGDKFDGQTAKAIAVTAALCGVSTPFVEEMRMADGKVCQALVRLFLV